MCEELWVAHAEIVAGGIDTQPMLPGAELNLRYALAAQPLVSKQGRRHPGTVHLRQDRRQCRAVLDGLVGSLTEMRQHRMCGVAKQRQASFCPGRQRLTVVQRPAKSLVHLLQDLADARVPAFELAPQHVRIAGADHDSFISSSVGTKPT